MTRTLSLGVVAAVAVCGYAAHARADGGTLDKIRASHALAFGFREASIPFSYLGAELKPVGFSIDLCNAIAERVKSDLKLDRLDVAFIPVNASNRIPLLQNGTIDTECGSTTNTVERQKQVAFSMTTFVSQPRWLVRADSGLTDPKQLDAKRVVVTQGSLSLPVVEKVKAGDHLAFSIIQAKDHGESLLMLRTDRASAWFEEDVLEAGLRATSPDPGAFSLLAAVYGSFNDALMVRKDDLGFKAVVDAVIKEKMASGDFGKLYAKWFTAPIPPRGQNLDLPMSDALKALVAKPNDAPAP